LALAGVVLALAARPAAGAPPASNDPKLASQWGLADIKAPEAWAKGKGGGVSVAVVSTGIAKHPDLATKTDGGFDAVAADPTNDTSGRGTHLAGIVGAATDNGIGIAGVAPDARLLPYKAFETDALVNPDSYLKALERVLSAKPQVVLVDLPANFPEVAKDPLRTSLKSLGDAGIAVVVGTQAGIPLGDLPVLTVAATTSLGDLVPDTPGPGGRGVAAPGQNIVSTSVSLLGAYSYGEQSGTGQAAAHAAGAVAILRGLGASATQSADLLRSTSRRSATSVAAGIIDVAAAVAAYRPPPGPPAPTTTTTRKPTPKLPTTKPPTGLGAIPTGTGPPSGPADFTGPPQPAEPVEPGAGENPVIPNGADTLTEPGGGGPSSTTGGGADRPVGLLTVGFGLITGVGIGLNLTFRRLAATPL